VGEKEFDKEICPFLVSWFPFGKYSGSRDRQLAQVACRPLWMLSLLAGLWFPALASAQVTVEIVASAEEAAAPVALTLTASTAPEDEPILGYEWRGIAVSPRCRARNCTIDFPVASCRRVEVSVTDRFGELTTTSRQVCAYDGTSRPPEANIDVRAGDPITVSAESVAGADRVVVTRLWIDDREAEGGFGELANDGQCHAVELLVADAQGRVGIDQRLVCPDGETPRIVVGADPTFCPQRGGILRACAEVIDPLGEGVDAIGGERVPLDGCAGLPVPSGVDRIVVRGETGGGVTHGSMIACTAPSSGRANLVFAALPALVNVVRGESKSAVLSIYGGEPPYAIDGSLEGSTTIGISRAGVDDALPAIELRVPAAGTWDRLELTITDARGLTAVATASVSTTSPPPMTMPPPMNSQPQSAVGFGCTATSGEAGWWMLGLLIVFLRRRR
jgi:MYXO-CTERM domain-containing protein